MEDRRNAPFCFQTLACTKLIRERFTGKERNTALGLYQAFTEYANMKRHEGGREGFRATRGEVAEFAGVTLRTLDRYAEEFADLGILIVSRTKEGKLNLPNTWSLIEPEVAQPTTPGGAANSTTSGEGVAQLEALPLAQPTAHLVEEGTTKKGENPPTPPLAGDPLWTDPVATIHGHWVKLMKPRSKKLDADQRKIINAALKVADAAECCGAITGCHRSPFHMGEGEFAGKRRYNTLGHILKGKRGGRTTREQIDMFLDVLDDASRRHVDNWGRERADYDRSDLDD